MLLLEAVKFFGIKLIDVKDFWELVSRFSFNMLISIIIVRFIYYPTSWKKAYLFTYVLFSIIVFFLCHLLSNVKLGLGFALGLFAIFGIIRYRTSTIPIKEMTYLFIIIGISVINALANKKVSYAELLFTNFAIVIATFGLEKFWLTSQRELSKSILYEKIELIKPDRRAELVTDLKERTGLNIHRVQIGQLDFVKDTANVRIYYTEDPEEIKRAMEHAGDETGNTDSL